MDATLNLDIQVLILGLIFGMAAIVGALVMVAVAAMATMRK